MFYIFIRLPIFIPILIIIIMIIFVIIVFAIVIAIIISSFSMLLTFIFLIFDHSILSLYVLNIFKFLINDVAEHCSNLTIKALRLSQCL